MNKYLFFIPALFITSSAAQASGLYIEGGLHFGGDELVSVDFIGGESESIEAGGLLSGAIGLITEIDENVELRTSIGLKFDFIAAENVDMTFSRLPLTAMLFAVGEKISFGMGATLHLNPTLDISGALGSADVDFDNALGFVAEVDFKLGTSGYIGLKATAIDYELNTGFGTAKVDGNSIGILLGARF